MSTAATNTSIRHAQYKDIETMMSMYEHSRLIMRNNGNQNQWVGGYPSMELIVNDIRRDIGYVIESDGSLVGCFAFIIGRDPTYEYIESGEWEEDDRPYGTIHRLACAAGRHNIFETCIDWCKTQTTSLRLDTHADNEIMLHLAEKHGFAYRGIIYIDDGTQRKAFQMFNDKTLCLPLKEYIESEILTRYNDFDSAHQRNHAETVINNSLRLAEYYTVDINMVYVIAAYHDLGLCEGRERHHIVSGEIMLNDKKLQKWFSQRQIKMMIEAVEDHRASSSCEPRSIYGKIVAEADRDIEPMKILQRTVQFGLEYYSELSYEEQRLRFVKHLKEKYGRNGYIKLWVPESDNAIQLLHLQDIIDNTHLLYDEFEKFYNIEKTRQKTY